MNFLGGIFGGNKKSNQPDQKQQKQNQPQVQAGNKNTPQKLNVSQQPSNPWMMESQTPQGNNTQNSNQSFNNLSNSMNMQKDNSQGNINSFNGISQSTTQEKTKGMFKNLKTKKTTLPPSEQPANSQDLSQNDSFQNPQLKQTQSAYVPINLEQKQNLDNSDSQNISQGDQLESNSTNTSAAPTPSKNAKNFARFKKTSQQTSQNENDVENNTQYTPIKIDDTVQIKEEKVEQEQEVEKPQKPEGGGLSMLQRMKKKNQQQQEEPQQVKQEEQPYIPSYQVKEDQEEQERKYEVPTYNISKNEEESQEQGFNWKKNLEQEEKNENTLQIQSENKQQIYSSSSLGSEKQSTPSSSKPSFLNKMKQKQAQGNTKIEDTPKSSSLSQKDEKYIMNKINEERIKLKEKLTEIVLKQNQLMSKTNYLQQDAIKLKKKLANIQREQEEYAEKDEFEEAEKLEEVIQHQQEDILLTEKQILSSQAEYNQYESEKEQLFKQEISYQESWLTQLSDFKKEKLREKEIYETEQNQKLKNEKYQIEEESERLKISEDHINLDKKHLDEERDQTQSNLSSQTGEFTAEKDKFLVQKKTLEKEIEEIKKKLQKKEKELSSVNETLEQLTLKINNIQAKFENQLRRIEQKEQKINEDLASYQIEKEEFEKNIIKNESNKQQFEKKLQEFDQTLENLQTTRNKLSEQILQIKELKENRESALTKYTDSYNTYANYKSTLQSDEEKLETLNEEKQKIDDEISEHLNKINSVSEKIPILENEKKSLVQQKKYKQAGTVANDIKDLTTQIEEMQKYVESQKQIELDILSQIDEINVRKSKSDKLLRELKKAADIDKYQLLLIKIKDLQSLHEFSVEQRHYDHSITLENEIKQTNSEIEQIRREYPEADKSGSSHNLKVESSQSLEQKITSNHKDLLELSDQEDNQGDDKENEDKSDDGEESKENRENNQIHENINNNSIGSNSNTMSSQQVTQADLDFQLRELISKIKDNMKKVAGYENEITHLVSAEEYEKADQIQQIVDEMNNKIDQQKEKLALNYSCLNLEEAENYLNQFKSEPHLPSEAASRDKSGNSPYSQNISSQGNIEDENKSEGFDERKPDSNEGQNGEEDVVEDENNNKEEEEENGQEEQEQQEKEIEQEEQNDQE